MSFEVDRYSSAWAHVALCADLTWATEPRDEFIIANQRLWAQHCRVSQALQESTLELKSSPANDCSSPVNKRTARNNKDICTSDRRSVQEVIPESRLAQFYGNFFYDDAREKCYTNGNERTNVRGYVGQGHENCDLTECWMLPEVEFWFRKLLDDSDRAIIPRRRRQYRMLPDEDLHVLTASERWDPNVARNAGEEALLAARVKSVRTLWSPVSPDPQRSRKAPRPPSPPPVSRKIRARRRQPRRLALPPSPPGYCIEVPAPLFCDPSCKFQFDPPRPPQLIECQKAIGRLQASVQAAMRASAIRCPPYRGTNVSRYAPTGQRPVRFPDRRCGFWWPRDHPSPRLNQKLQLTHIQCHDSLQKTQVKTDETKTGKEDETEPPNEAAVLELQEGQEDSPKHEEVVDNEVPSTSAAAMEAGLKKKRLYSTVLSMTAPTPINLTPVARLAQKLVTPGILKLNRILPNARMRPPNVDHKFEELEKEALEQYKASDESIDTKFQELEDQAVEQYSASNSNTSCSSENSTEKKTSDIETNTNKQSEKFHKEKPVDSVVIYSQNFPDLNSKTSVMSLKNFHTPPRGEKKEHRSKNSRPKKVQRTASDTDNERRENNFKNYKASIHRTLHVVPPKKRHLTLCVSDFSFNEDLVDTTGSIKDAGPRIKKHLGKIKMSAHGGGDLRPLMRKT